MGAKCKYTSILNAARVIHWTIQLESLLKVLLFDGVSINFELKELLLIKNVLVRIFPLGCLRQIQQKSATLDGSPPVVFIFNQTFHLLPDCGVDNKSRGP